jgi:hypothetical protein
VFRTDLTENDFLDPHPAFLLQVFDDLKPAYSTAAYIAWTLTGVRSTELWIGADAVLEATLSVSFGLDGQRDLHPPLCYKFDDLKPASSTAAL